MTKREPKAVSAKPSLRLGGGGVSAALGLLASNFIETPHGYANNMFAWIAVLCAFAGFEIGTLLGTWNRIVAGTATAFAAIVAFLMYYWIISNYVGGLIPGLFVPFLFGMAFLTLFAGLGIFGLQVFEMASRRSR
jgi:hypothetical protein